MKRDIFQIPNNHNNMFTTCFLNTYLNNLNQKFNFNYYNYTDNRDYYDYLANFFCQKMDYIYYNWSSDYIIKDIFMFLKDSIWFELPNYGMLKIYTKLFNLKYKNISSAQNLYITFPNINTSFSIIKDFNNLKDFIKENRNKLIIIDFAYYNNLFSFFDLIEIIKELQSLKKDILIIFSFTKFTGNANLKQGILITFHPILQKIISFMNPHRINNQIKFLIMNLNKEILEKHRKILNNLKEKKIIRLKPEYLYGFNLFFKNKKMGKFIKEINLYRYSINECRKDN